MNQNKKQVGGDRHEQNPNSHRPKDFGEETEVIRVPVSWIAELNERKAALKAEKKASGK